ncbi:MAG: hypothetical protein ACRDPW_10405, partial [Mycobacteriales bacterium]
MMPDVRRPLLASAPQYTERVTAPVTGAYERVSGVPGFSLIRVSPASLEYFSTLIRAFRRMDDLEGGSAENLKQITGAIATLTRYLGSGSFTEPGLRQSLLEILARLSQIAGWMAFDAERHGLARRHFQAGLDAARRIDDHGLIAHILSFMSYQA